MKKQVKSKDNRLSAANWFDIIFVSVGGIALDLFLQFRLRGIRPASYISADALRNLRHYLAVWIVTHYLRILTPALMILLSGCILRLIRRKPSESPKLRLIAAGGLTVLCLLGSLKQRSGFELQCGLNGYRGTAAMQVISLYDDIYKDEILGPGKTVQHPVKGGTADYSYSVSGGRGQRRRTIHVQEAALYDADTNEPIAQISQEDYQLVSNLNGLILTRSITLFPHSGLIASVDDTPDASELANTEKLFTLTYSEDDQTIRRTTLPDENMPEGNLTLVIERNGERAAEIGMENDTSMPWHSGNDTTAWLQIRRNGSTYRVSNKLTF